MINGLRQGGLTRSVIPSEFFRTQLPQHPGNKRGAVGVPGSDPRRNHFRWRAVTVGMKTAQRFLTAGAVALSAACRGDSTEPGSGPAQIDLQCIIPSEEIFSGGVSRDGIPALTNPDAVGASQASFLTNSDRVLGIVVNGEARAYPMGVLWWHEIVNDVLGGEPVLVTYCPLTGSGIAFDPRVDGGAARNFGVSGLLWRTNLTMFDRESETLWNQMLLGGTCGVDRGRELTRLPIVETTWAHWAFMYPNTTVMSEDTGFLDRPYGIYPYGDYDQQFNDRINFLAPGTSFSNDRPPKELVLGIHVGEVAKAYPFGALAGAGVGINDEVGGLPLLVTYVASKETAIAFDRRLNGQELTFTPDSKTRTLTDEQTGSVWNTVGEATAGPLAGEHLRQLPDAYVAFWFAWSIYFSDTELFLNP